MANLNEEALAFYKELNSQLASGGAVGVSVNRDVFFTPSSYSRNVEVNSITDMTLATTATDAKVIRLTVALVTGSPGALYVAFGTNSADAISNVNATSGSEAGMLLSLTPADGDTYEITIPANAQDGGVLAAGITGYVDTTNELVLNVTQGV